MQYKTQYTNRQREREREREAEERVSKNNTNSTQLLLSFPLAVSLVGKQGVQWGPTLEGVSTSTSTTSTDTRTDQILTLTDSGQDSNVTKHMYTCI